MSLADSPLDLFFGKQAEAPFVCVNSCGVNKALQHIWLRKGSGGEILLVWHGRAALRFSSCRELVLYTLTLTNATKTFEAFRGEALGYQRSGIYQNKNHCQFNKVFLGIVLQQLLSLLPSLKWSQWEEKIARPKRGNNKIPIFLLFLLLCRFCSCFPDISTKKPQKTNQPKKPNNKKRN